MHQQYYQIGGLQPHIEWLSAYRYDDKKVAELIAGDASPLRPRDSKQPVELVLGIKRTGTSHLLLTKPQLHQIERAAALRFPTRPAATSTDFESLSPIYFNDPNQFAAKLSALKIKTVKKRSPTDNSQANKQFLSGDAGVQRGGFEHGRLFYRTLYGYVDLQTYGLNDASWARSFNVCSFVFTPRSHDTRSSEDRRKRPIALDCGFAEATTPELEVREGSSQHLYFTNNRFMTAKGERLSFEHGATEELDGLVINARVRNFFSQSTSTAKPTILLVHDEELTRSMLQNCGVETSSWESGLKGFLGYRRDSRRDRDRSQSPPRSYQHAGPSSRNGYFPRRPSPGSSHRGHTQSSSSYRSAHAPVYVVDIKAHFMTLMQTATSSESVINISKYLGQTQAEGWCAGNEAVMIINLWRLMISGLPIDEQRASREPGRLGASESVARVEYDSDQDPNEFPPQAAQQAQRYDPASDSNYGESSDDSD